MAVHVIISTHQKSGDIAGAVASVLHQGRAPDSLTVVTDRCDDATTQVADAAGAVVVETPDGSSRRAVALNQILTRLLPSCHQDDVVLVMDGTTRLAPRFLERAVGLISADPSLGAVGGVIVGDRPSGWLEWCQAHELSRHAARYREGGVLALAGTASVLRVRALREVCVNRSGMLPGRAGDVYDEDALAEDDEITWALRHLGWRLTSAQECRVWTELKPTMADLHRQRLPWYRGVVDTLFRYGLTRVTLPYWGQRALAGVSVGILAMIGLVSIMAAFTDTVTLSPWWQLVGLGLLLARLVVSWQTRSRGGLVVRALLLPEFVYDLVLQVTFVQAVVQSIRATWATRRHITPVRQIPSPSALPPSAPSLWSSAAADPSRSSS
ncbi:MAG: glycosyltransferase [Angustibacter sp.]